MRHRCHRLVLLSRVHCCCVRNKTASASLIHPFDLARVRKHLPAATAKHFCQGLSHCISSGQSCISEAHASREPHEQTLFCDHIQPCRQFPHIGPATVAAQFLTQKFLTHFPFAAKYRCQQIASPHLARLDRQDSNKTQGTVFSRGASKAS